MNLKNIFLYLSSILVLCVTIVYSLEQLSELSISDQLNGFKSNVVLNRVKRKGGRGGGGRSSGRSRGSSKTRVQPASNPSSYPKQGGQGQQGTAGGYGQQPAYNPGYQNPGGAAPGGYPKQPGQTGYGGAGYGQTGHNYGQQAGYPQTGYGQNYGKTGGLGGIGTGLGGYGKSKGMGGLGAGLAGGALGAAVGAYGGYKLGKMVGGFGRYGHYGYYDDHYRYIRCDPPPKIEVDPTTNITYIPKTITYDARCDYYDREPPKIHPHYAHHYDSRGYYIGGASNAYPSILTQTLATISFVLIVFNDVFLRFGANGLKQILI